MKVKKKYFIITGILILSAITLFITAFWYITTNYGINYTDGKRYVLSGFSNNPAQNEEIDEYNTENQELINVLHYEIHLDLFTEKEIIVGKTKITFEKIKTGANKLDINLSDELIVNSVKLDYVEVDFIFEDDLLTITLPNYNNNSFIAEINYQGTPENLGFGSFSFQEYRGDPVVYSLSEPIFASTWFPCVDRPSDKVLADIIISNDSSMVSVSNGILINTTESDGRKTYHWQTKYPISTYLISIYSANYEHFYEQYISATNDTMQIDYYVFENHLENAKKDFSIHLGAMKHLVELFGEYPFINEKYGVAEFMWSFGAMEHQTITGIGKNFVSGNQFFTGMLVHELAHQWWGNAVTLESWKDIWLNEGFATYSEALYWEKESGVSALRSSMRRWNTNFDGTKLYNPEELFDRIIYNKGAWVLHMLRKKIGDDNFFSLLKKYYETFKYDNASTEDFMKLAEKISNKSLTQFFKQWVFEGEGKIEIEYSYSQNDKNEIEIEIHQIQDGYNSYDFQLDLDFFIGTNHKERKTIKVSNRNSTYIFEFDKHVTKIDVDPENWLAADIQYVDRDEN